MTRILNLNADLGESFGAWQMGSVMAFFDGSYPKAGAAIVFVYLIGMIAIWFAPETKGRPLPE